MQGQGARGASQALLVSRWRDSSCTLYLGTSSINNGAAIVPNDPTICSALWAFCSVAQTSRGIRKLDQKLNVHNGDVRQSPLRPGALAECGGGEISARVAEAVFQRPDPMALQRPPQGLRRAAPSRRRPPARLPLATPDRLRVPGLPGPGSRRAGAPRGRGRHRLPAAHQQGGPRRGAPARPARRRLRRGLDRRHRAGPARRHRGQADQPGRLAAGQPSSSNTASSSTTAPSSGTSGTAARTASMPWSTTTAWTTPTSRSSPTATWATGFASRSRTPRPTSPAPPSAWVPPAPWSKS